MFLYIFIEATGLSQECGGSFLRLLQERERVLVEYGSVLFGNSRNGKRKFEVALRYAKRVSSPVPASIRRADLHKERAPHSTTTARSS